MSSMQVSSPVASTNAAAAANKDKEKEKNTADSEHVSSTVTQFAGTAVREESTAAVETKTETEAPSPAVAEAQAEVAVAQARLDLAEARLDRAELSEETVVAKHDGEPAPKEVVQVTEKATDDVESSAAHLASVEDKTGVQASTTTEEAPPPQTKEEADQRVAAAEAELAKAVDQQAQLKTGTTPVDEAQWEAATADSSDQVTNPPPPPAPPKSTQDVVAAGQQVDQVMDQNKLDEKQLATESGKVVTQMGTVDDLVADNQINQQQLAQSSTDFVSAMAKVDQYMADVLAGKMPSIVQPKPELTTQPVQSLPQMPTVDSTQMRLLELLNQLMQMLMQGGGAKPQLPPTSSPVEMGNVIGRLENATNRFERAENEAGTLGAYMRAKGLKTLDVNQLYNLSNNKGGKVPEDVQQAAKFMLQNPDIYKKIETSDVAGADGISGVGNFDKAAQGLTQFERPVTAHRAAIGVMPQPNLGERAKDEAGALAAYMNANGMKKLDVNQLYNLSNNKAGNVPPDVQQAAKFMLQHPEIYKKIETADVKGADGISGVGNMNKAAQGLINLDRPAAPEIRAAVMPRSTLGERAENEAGTLAAFMNAKGLKTIDVNQLYKLSNNQGGDVPQDVQQAAKFMLQHPAIFKKIETADVKGADGISGVGNLNKAAQGLINLDRPAAPVMRAAVMPRESLGERAENEAGTLAAYMNSKGLGAIDVNQLYNLSNNKGGDVPKDVQQAAKFMLKNPEIFKKIETADVAGADGISGVGNLNKAAQGLIDLSGPGDSAIAMMQRMQAAMAATRENAQQQLQALLSGGVQLGAAVNIGADVNTPFGVQGDEDESENVR